MYVIRSAYCKRFFYAQKGFGLAVETLAARLFYSIFKEENENGKKTFYFRVRNGRSS